MRLIDCVAADRMAVPLRSTTLSGAAEELVELLAASGRVHAVDRLRQRVAEARPEDLVALGDRAFLLHYRTDAADELMVAIGTSPTPLCRTVGEKEPQCARIVLLVVAPPGMAARYLQVVGAFARLLARPERVAEVLAQPDAESLAALPSLAEVTLPAQLTVREIMSESPYTVAPTATLREAARLMERTRVSALPVVDEDGRLLGMLGDRELMRELLTHYLHQLPSGRGSAEPGGERTVDRPVREVMNRQVLGVSPEQPLADVASMMTNKDVDRLPVVREGKLVGFLSRGDIVRKLLGS